MTDYMTALQPPDYRNLVVNPGGEPSYSASWFATNGIVRSGVSDTTTPYQGLCVAEYTVTHHSSLPYTVSPFGPEGPVHMGGFEIPASRTVSAMASLSTPDNVWARLQAQFMVWNGTNFDEVATQPLGELTHVGVYTISTPAFPDSTDSPTGDNFPGGTSDTVSSGWVTFIGYADETIIPSGATHWFLQIAIYATEATDTDTSAPALGTRLWVDRTFVPDSGVSLDGTFYVDGDEPGCVWEGTRFFSTSRTGSVPGPFVIPEALPALIIADQPSEPVLDVFPDDEVLSTPLSTATLTVLESPPELPDGFADISAREILARRIPLGPNDMCLDGDVQLQHLRFNRIDEDGVLWIITDVENWWTLPEPDLPDIPKGWKDGSYEARGRYLPRVINLAGVFIPRSKTLVARARNQLLMAADLVHGGGYFMTHDSEAFKGAKVWLSGQPLIQTTSTIGKTEFTIGLKAPDPIKYSIEDGIPPGYSSITVTSKPTNLPGRSYPRQYPWTYPQTVFGVNDAMVSNIGNTPVSPVFMLKGPTYGPVDIHNVDTQQIMTVTKQLYPGETLTIDCGTGLVTLNDAPNQRFYLSIDVDWIRLQPGGNRVFFSESETSSSNAKLTILWRSGWIG